MNNNFKKKLFNRGQLILPILSECSSVNIISNIMLYQNSKDVIRISILFKKIYKVTDKV